MKNFTKLCTEHCQKGFQYTNGTPHHQEVKVKLATVVKGDQKAPFPIASTPRCREGATPFPGLLHFTLDTYLILLSVKQGGFKYHF